jgi:LPS-assembly lipoprotein
MRRAVFFLLLLSPLLAACGFEPLYAEHARATLEPRLAAIKILPIKEHTGQLLEWSLREALNPADIVVEPRYALHITVTMRQINLATQTNAISTRGSIAAAVDCILTTLDNKTVLYRGKIQSVEDYNIIQDAYASEMARNGAEKRVVDDVSEEIATRLTVFLRERAAAQ